MVELAEGDRERPGRPSTCAIASAREHAGPEALPHEASDRADAAVADKTGVAFDAGDVEGEVPPLAAAGHARGRCNRHGSASRPSLAPPPTRTASRPSP